nr:ABC transporter ATP-binding protein [Rhodoplanes tepidamans]
MHGVSLDVSAGEIVALVGSNGAGKTTLLRTLSGVQPATGGRILFDGEDIGRLPPHARVVRGIVQSPEGRQVFGPLSVEDNLRLGAFRRWDDTVKARLEAVYAMFPVLSERRRTAASSLSGGQQQMLAIGRALMAQPKLLLLDEPSLGLAPLLVDQILAAVVDLKSRGITVLLVEQNASAALAIADRGYVLEVGHVVHEGAGAALLQDPKVRAAYLGV